MRKKNRRISFDEKDADLLYEVLHHCNEHLTWMREVFANGENLSKLESRLIEFLNHCTEKEEQKGNT